MKKDGGPAFPSNMAYDAHGDPVIMTDGLTKREWFAGQIICGLIANPNVNLSKLGKEPVDFTISLFSIADAMIAEGDK
jgi:hypothetical protein